MLLLCLCRPIRTAADMRTFLEGVIPRTQAAAHRKQRQQQPQQQGAAQTEEGKEGSEDEEWLQEEAENPAADAAAAAGHGTAAPPPCGSRKRKQRAPERVQPWHHRAAAAAGGGGQQARGMDSAKRHKQPQAQAASAQAPPGSATKDLPPVDEAGMSQQLAAAGVSPAAAPAAAPGAGGPSAAATLAERMAMATQRKEQQALKAFETADMDSPDGMLRPLRLLALAGHGGQLLRVSLCSATMWLPLRIEGGVLH